MEEGRGGLLSFDGDEMRERGGERGEETVSVG